MRHAARDFIASTFSFVVFTAITLAIASTTYQVLKPDGGLISWIVRTWEFNPALLVTLGGIVLLAHRWLSGVQGARAADTLFYAAVMLGLYCGFNLLIGV